MSVHAAQRQGRRPHMQDRVLAAGAMPGLQCLGGVFDGHGGDSCADWMSKHFGGLVHKALLEERDQFGAASTPAGARRALHRACASAENHLMLLSARDGLKDGTTACVVAVSPRSLLCLNVGDTRAVLCRAGRAVPLSRDHKPNDPREIQRIHAAGGLVMTARQHSDPRGHTCADCRRLSRGAARAAAARTTTAWAAGATPAKGAAPPARRRGVLARMFSCCASPDGGAGSKAAPASSSAPCSSASGCGDDDAAAAARVDFGDGLASAAAPPTETLPARRRQRTASRSSSSIATTSGDDGHSESVPAAYVPCERHQGSARVWPGGLSVSRALGDFHLKISGCGVQGEDGPLVARPDLAALERVHEDEFIIVASDGFWDVRSNGEAVREARSLLARHDGDEAARIMAMRAEEDGSSDNITVLLVRLR